MSDLLPCPFCGKHLVWEAPVAFVHPIGKCILSGRNFKKGPIQQWNRRALPAASSEDVRAGALKEAADACQRIAGNTKDFNAAHRRAAGQCAAMILALIPGSKP